MHFSARAGLPLLGVFLTGSHVAEKLSHREKFSIKESRPGGRDIRSYSPLLIGVLEGLPPKPVRSFRRPLKK